MMLFDRDAIGIMATVAGSVGGTAFFLGRKISSMVTKDRCNKTHNSLDDELKVINKTLGRIQGKLGIENGED